jgi:hypothetical protein
MPEDMPENAPQRGEDMRWGFGVLAAIIVLIIVSWASGAKNGWGQRNQLAHMAPPVAYLNDGPVTRAFIPPSNGR